MPLNDMLRVNEIFLSIDGEISPWLQGRPSIFVRLQGCNSACKYCDTVKTQDIEGGYTMPIKHIWQLVKEHKCKKLTITGGEPLRQDIEPLIELAIKDDYKVSIETNGTLECKRWWIGLSNISFIIDIKLPSSGINKKLIKIDWIQNMCLYQNTWVKFAIKDVEDFVEASYYIETYGLPTGKCAFSPVFSGTSFNTKELFSNMMKCGYSDSVLSVQVHKLIGMA